MSVSHTTEQVRNRTKTVTRRLGWRMLKVGDRLTLCEKVMGRKKGDPLVRLCDVDVVSVNREHLDLITPSDVHAEGFPDWTPADFVAFFCETFGGTPDQIVTRIEWRYLPCPVCHGNGFHSVTETAPLTFEAEFCEACGGES